MTKEKMLQLELKLSEVITGECGSVLKELFSISQMILGIERIKPILDDFNKQLHIFINSTLVSNKKELIKLKLRLFEVVITEEGLIMMSLCSNSQMISGIERIKSILDIFNKLLHNYIDSTLIPNNIK